MYITRSGETFLANDHHSFFLGSGNMALIDFVTITPLLSLGPDPSVIAKTRRESGLPEVQEVSPPSTPFKGARRRLTAHNTTNPTTITDTYANPGVNFASPDPYSDSVLLTTDLDEEAAFETGLENMGFAPSGGEIFWGEHQTDQLLNANLNQMSLNDDSWLSEL